MYYIIVLTKALQYSWEEIDTWPQSAEVTNRMEVLSYLPTSTLKIWNPKTNSSVLNKSKLNILKHVEIGRDFTYAITVYKPCCIRNFVMNTQRKFTSVKVNQVIWLVVFWYCISIHKNWCNDDVEVLYLTFERLPESQHYILDIERTVHWFCWRFCCCCHGDHNTNNDQKHCTTVDP